MAHKSIFLTLLVIFLINKVSATKCYSCSSSQPYDACTTDPKQKDFEAECKVLYDKDSMFGRLGFVQPSDSDVFKSLAIEYQCSTVIQTVIVTNVTIVSRGCMPKHISDETYKIMSVIMGLQVSKIRRCDGNLCIA